MMNYKTLKANSIMNNTLKKEYISPALTAVHFATERGFAATSLTLREVANTIDLQIIADNQYITPYTQITDRHGNTTPSSPSEPSQNFWNF